MEEILARAVQVMLAVSGAYLVALWFVLVVWTYRDIESRSKNVFTQIVGTLMSVLFFIPGTLLYLLLRPKETLDTTFQRTLEEEYLLQDLEEQPVCHSCARPVNDDYVLCPNCRTTLRQPCVSCDRLISVKWGVCPYCASEQTEHAVIEKERVAIPDPRWVARQPGAFQPSGQPAAVPSAVLTMRPPAGLTWEEAAELPANVAPIRLFDRRMTRAINGRVEAIPGEAVIAEALASLTQGDDDDAGTPSASAGS